MSNMEKCPKCGSEKLQALPLKMASIVLCADCRHTWTHRWANEATVAQNQGALLLRTATPRASKP